MQLFDLPFKCVCVCVCARARPCKCVCECARATLQKGEFRLDCHVISDIYHCMRIGIQVHLACKIRASILYSAISHECSSFFIFIFFTTQSPTTQWYRATQCNSEISWCHLESLSSCILLSLRVALCICRIGKKGLSPNTLMTRAVRWGYLFSSQGTKPREREGIKCMGVDMWGSQIF